MSKAAQIRTLLSEGLDPKEVAEKAGVKVQYVHDVRYKMSHRSKPAKKKVAWAATTVPSTTTAPDQSKIDGLKKYIMHLETELLMRDGAIGALRNKLYAASV